MPTDIRCSAGVIFDEIAESLLKFSEYVTSLYDIDAPRRSKSGDISNVVLIYDEFHSLDEYSPVLRVADAVISEAAFQSSGSAELFQGTFEECRSMAEEISMRGFIVLVGGNYITDKAREVRMKAAMTWMLDLARRNDGMCRLICRVFDEDLLTRLLSYFMHISKGLAHTLHDLLLTLMADQSFKVVIACAYTQAYKTISRLYSRGLGLSTQSVYNLSVQFLNREVFVNEVCYNHSFLKIALAAMSSMLRHALQQQQQLDTNNDSNMSR